MKNSRRKFIKYASLAGLGLAGTRFLNGSPVTNIKSEITPGLIGKSTTGIMTQNADISLIGQYGKWATTLANDKIPSLSFRRNEFRDLNKWHQAAEAKVKDRLSIPDIGVCTFCNC